MKYWAEKNRENQQNQKFVFFKKKNQQNWDFPGGAVVKNPPASAGDTGSIPGPRSHMLRSN